MKKLPSILLVFFVCFILSSCVESTSPGSPSAGDKVLDFSDTNFINKDNVSDFGFGGGCKGYSGSSLSYSLGKVQGEARGEVVKEGKVDCTNGVWAVSRFDVTDLSDGDYKVTVSLEGGKSLTATVVKDTEAPTVSLKALPERSKENSLTLAGTCSESGVVTYNFLNQGQSSLCPS